MVSYSQQILILKMSFKLIVLMIASLAIFYKNQAQTTDSIDNECSTEVEDIDLGKIIF